MTRLLWFGVSNRRVYTPGLILHPGKRHRTERLEADGVRTSSSPSISENATLPVEGHSPQRSTTGPRTSQYPTPCCLFEKPHNGRGESSRNAALIHSRHQWLSHTTGIASELYHS